MTKRILLLEDDPEQSVTLLRKLSRRYPTAVIARLESEFELYDLLGDIERGEALIPDVVIADVMMPWVTAMENPPVAPPEVREGGYSTAGVRCLQKFRESCDTQIPWVILSCREPDAVIEDLKINNSMNNVLVLSKERQANELLQEIQNILDR